MTRDVGGLGWRRRTQDIFKSLDLKLNGPYFFFFFFGTPTMSDCHLIIT